MNISSSFARNQVENQKRFQEGKSRRRKFATLKFHFPPEFRVEQCAKYVDANEDVSDLFRLGNFHTDH